MRHTLPPRRPQRWKWHLPSTGIFMATALLLFAPQTIARRHLDHPPALRPKPRQSGSTPLIITNYCSDTIYPGIITQSGGGPGTGGFELDAGNQQTFSVSEDWQGRVWGRTNCSVSGNSAQCDSGDCGGVLSCEGTGNVPTTLAEFTFDAGDGHTYYDISLVDGYNLPLAIVMHPQSNSSFQAIPLSLTNPSCVASVGDAVDPGFNPYGNGDFLGTNASDPLPFEDSESLSDIAQWCPWNLQQSTSTGPSDGVYIYPDGNLNRPIFDPCVSACAKWNQPQDCCTGSYGSPSSCQPSEYSQAAKKVCPDAYSYAFDDQTSTFIIPAGAGFEVIFCPGGRSTNIIATSKNQLVELAQQGHINKLRMKRQSLPQFLQIDILHRGTGIPKPHNRATKSGLELGMFALGALSVVGFIAFLL